MCVAALEPFRTAKLSPIVSSNLLTLVLHKEVARLVRGARISSTFRRVEHFHGLACQFAVTCVVAKLVSTITGRHHGSGSANSCIGEHNCVCLSRQQVRGGNASCS